MRSSVQRSSFCAMDSTATLREHVTSTRAPGGTRPAMMWKMVVDLPAPAAGPCAHIIINHHNQAHPHPHDVQDGRRPACRGTGPKCVREIIQGYL